MKVHELIEMLRTVNQMADVGVTQLVTYSEYTQGDEWFSIVNMNVSPWGDPKNATQVELLTSEQTDYCYPEMPGKSGSESGIWPGSEDVWPKG